MPPAAEVKAIADCTVAGSAHRYRKPRYTVGVIKFGTSRFIASPSSGNSAKVLRNTTKCSFQWPMPAIIA
ncbi:hypothetical protein GGER_27910 [Serratia rubidaea]